MEYTWQKPETNKTEQNEKDYDVGHSPLTIALEEVFGCR